MAKHKSEKKEGFEESLQRLEKIVEEMEDGSLPLEKMMADFEEGMKLVKICSGRLNEFERKIEMLVKDEDGFKTEPFNETETDGAEDSE